MLAYEVPVRLVDQGTDWPAWITAGFTAAAVLGIGVAVWSLKDAKRTRHGMLVPVAPVRSCKLAVLIERSLTRTTVPSPTEEAAILVTA